MRVGVYWKNALGLLIFEAPCMHATTAEYFYIKIEYEFDRGVKIDAGGLLDELNLPENHVERKSILSALHHLDSAPVLLSPRKFAYTLGISRATLEANGGVIYLNDVDLVVGLETCRQELIHPFTLEGNKQALSLAAERTGGFQQRVLLVDNANTIGPRWMNNGHTLVEVKPINDPGCRDGVYVTTIEGPLKGPTTEHYEFPDADKALGLYRTKAEAEVYGAPDVRFHAEMKEREQAIAVEKMEMQRERARLDNEQKDADQRRRTFEEEMTRLRERHDLDVDLHKSRMKMESEKLAFAQDNFTRSQKFEFEVASNVRKDRSDYMRGVIDIGKAVLTVVTMGISIYALAKKSK